MDSFKITGVLYGESKSVTVKATDELEAMNKIKSKYPDFEVASADLDFPTESSSSDAHHQPSKSKARPASLEIELLTKIEQNTHTVATLAKIILFVLAVIVVFFVFSFFVGLGSGITG